MPKLLWLSPLSLHDNLSNAAINCKILLESLAQIGWTVYACSALNKEACSDQTLVKLRQQFGSFKHPGFSFQDKNVEYAYLACNTCDEAQMSINEMEGFFELSCKVMSFLMPDIVIGYGANVVLHNCFAEAKRRGLCTAYMLLNGNHEGYSFPHVDLILTSSQSNARLYYNRSKINAIPIGEFFNPENYMITQREPTYITYVNPALDTGMALFAKIALDYQMINPKQRFLVVNRHERFFRSIQNIRVENDQLYYNAALSEPETYTSFANITNKDFPNVDLTAPEAKMRDVYSYTKLLLIPTVKWEAWGRIATESILNNIPVVASTSGGLPEATLGAGIHVDVPQRLLKDKSLLPTDAEIAPWLKAIKIGLESDFTERFKKAKERFLLSNAFGRFQEAIAPLIQKCKKACNGYIIPEM